MSPNPPARVTAAASRPPAANAIGAETMGCSMRKRSVRRVVRVTIPRLSSDSGGGGRAHLRSLDGDAAFQGLGNALRAIDKQRRSGRRAYLKRGLLKHLEPAREVRCIDLG